MDMEFECDEQDRRFIEILGAGQPLEEPPFVTAKTLATYHEFLSKHCFKDILLTGRESCGYFSWEERFEFGYGDEAEYKKSCQTQGSYKDTYQFVALSTLDEEWGSLIQVRRVGDNQMFEIPLADLEICKKAQASYQLVEDYGSWMVNYND